MRCATLTQYLESVGTQATGRNARGRAAKPQPSPQLEIVCGQAVRSHASARAATSQIHNSRLYAPRLYAPMQVSAMQRRKSVALDYRRAGCMYPFEREARKTQVRSLRLYASKAVGTMQV